MFAWKETNPLYYFYLQSGNERNVLHFRIVNIEEVGHAIYKTKHCQFYILIDPVLGTYKKYVNGSINHKLKLSKNAPFMTSRIIN